MVSGIVWTFDTLAFLKKAKLDRGVVAGGSSHAPPCHSTFGFTKDLTVVFLFAFTFVSLFGISVQLGSIWVLFSPLPATDFVALATFVISVFTMPGEEVQTQEELAAQLEAEVAEAQAHADAAQAAAVVAQAALAAIRARQPAPAEPPAPAVLGLPGRAAEPGLALTVFPPQFPGGLAPFQATPLQMSLCPSPPIQRGLERLAPRLRGILESQQVPTDLMTKLAESNVTTVAVFTGLADTRAGFRDFLRGVLGLDPSVRPADFVPTAAFIAAFDSANINVETETREAAKRHTAGLPPALHETELTTIRKAFSLQEAPLEDCVAPSRAYFERKLAEFDTALTAEPLTMVTSVAVGDHHSAPAADVEPGTGILKLTTGKVIGVALPTTSEQFRARMETLGVCWMYVKLKTQRQCLATFSLSLWERYVKFLIGPRVWGQAILDTNGRAISSPTLPRVITYELEIRKRATDLLNQGHDFRNALLMAQDDSEIRSLHFLQPVALESHSAGARAVTAPGADKGTKRKTEDNDNEVKATKSAKKKKNQAAKMAELQKQLDQAKANGRRNNRNGDNRNNTKGGAKGANGQPKGGGKGAGDGAAVKGAGKGLPDGASSRTPDPENLSICFGYNKPTGCPHTACRMKHVCWFCFKSNHGGHTCRGA